MTGFIDAMYKDLNLEGEGSGGTNQVTLTEDQLKSIADAVISKLNNAPANKPGADEPDADDQAEGE